MTIYDYLKPKYFEEDEVLQNINKDIQKNADPKQINAQAGKTLYMLVKMIGAKNILEIGTMYGYSTVWLARATEGHIDTIEKLPENIEHAKNWFKEARVEDRITVHEGYSKDILPTLKDEYDLIFMDGEKAEYVNDAIEAIRLLKVGGILVADNVLWMEKVADETYQTRSVESIRNFHDLISGHPQLESIVLPVDDGFSISIKRK